ncbi:hypothetical protein ACQ5SB_20580 [Stenotrophomonas geniculata]|uniref:hypothetical protein n=1 Tax=Stenotrophomonas geniculata TaxID=86188 RepID=UPI003D35698C
MTDHDFFAAMAVGIPPITPPTLKADSTGLVRGIAGDDRPVTTWIVPLPTTSTDGATATQEQSNG